MAGRGLASKGKKMTPQQFKRIRTDLGLSQAALAAKLGLGENGARTVQRIEGGHGTVTGPMSLAMEKLRDDAAGE